VAKNTIANPSLDRILMKKPFTSIALFGVLTASAMTATCSAAEESRPNIIVVLVDDMGWSDIGCYGSEISTPNLDALASQGVRFTQFYNTGRCSPTRASLLTGHYPHQAGMGHLDGTLKPNHPGFQGKLADTSVTMAEVLGDAGYFTAMTGKWHLGQQHGTPPWERGFQRSLNLQAGGVHFANQGGAKGNAKLYLDGQEKSLTDPLFGDDWYGTDLWTRWGLKFIDEAISAEKPFFLYLAHCAPHFPLMAPQADINRYRGKYKDGWDKLRAARYQKQIQIGLIDKSWPLSPLADGTPSWDSLSADEQDRYDHMMAIYAAMIDAMDRSVGDLVNGLKQRNSLDNTLLLFLSDNGGNAESGVQGRYQGDQPGDPNSNVFIGQTWATLNNTPFRKYKHFVHEGGTATPLIVHWPNDMATDRRGQLEHQPGHLIDIMATVVQVADAAYPVERKGVAIEAMEGTSLIPAIHGKPLDRKQPLFFNHEDNRAVRDGKWKIVALKDKPWELYDLEADRTEISNLANQQPERLQMMSDQYVQWATRTRVVVPGMDVAAPTKPGKNKKRNKANLPL
jgi:arylsulfatase A-like enzyme